MRNILLLMALTIAAATQADDLKLPPILSDHMVLQRYMPIRVFGETKPGASVTVELWKSKETVKADKAGKWLAELPAMEAGGPHEILVSSDKSRIVLKDILVGDVWLCSGQSNMGLSVASLTNASDVLKKAKRPKLRLFRMRSRASLTRQDSFHGQQSSWAVSSPQAARGFSAVGYAFGANLQDHVDVPIGLIQSHKPGTFIESWIPRARMTAPVFEPILKRWDFLKANNSRLVADYKKRHGAWKKEHQARFNQWKKHRTGGPFLPHQPWPIANERSPLHPGNLFNTMIAPLTRQALKGVIWYQGESNSDRAYQYRELLPQLIKTWRAEWKQDLPFAVVQLPTFETDSNPYDRQDGGDWAVLRESQLQVLKVKGTALVTTTDLGERYDVHPKNKWPIGVRCALAARKIAYNENLVYSGPVFDRMETNGGKVRLYFKHTGKGLVSRSGAWIGFELAGSDRKFYPAEARLIGKDCIELSSSKVSTAVAARYAFDDDPKYCLYNSAGLPASSFRTDTWPVPTQGVVEPFHWLR